jgi:hypothetical protein
LIRVFYKNGTYGNFYQGVDGDFYFSSSDVGEYPVCIAGWEAFSDIEAALKDGCRVEYVNDDD